jgi:hypothetical protein
MFRRRLILLSASKRKIPTVTAAISQFQIRPLPFGGLKFISGGNRGPFVELMHWFSTWIYSSFTEETATLQPVERDRQDDIYDFHTYRLDLIHLRGGGFRQKIYCHDV